MDLTITILGSGTSAGVPMIGCHCPVCESPDPKDKRTRVSVALTYDSRTVLIDTGPELRLQARACHLDRIHAVVYTHAHADHIFGLDDLRRYNTILGTSLPIFADPQTLAHLQRVFAYAFVPPTLHGVYRPELVPHPVNGPFEVLGKTWTPIRMFHGLGHSFGYRIGNFAYCTDCKVIPPESLDLLHGLDTLILGALRPNPHPAHLSFGEALEIVATLKPKNTYFTHLTHDVTHADLERMLPPHVRPLYDGLVLHST